MKIIYEKEIEVTDKISKEKTKEFKEVKTEGEATYKHICRHDEGRPCKRIKL